MRTFAEWLVIPLVILPLLVAIGLLLWAQDAHRRDLAPYRQNGAEQARIWLEAAARDPDPGAGLRALTALDPSYDPRGISIEHPAGPARIVVDEPMLGPAPWRFVDAFPGGLRAMALADPAIRLQVEAGRSPAALDAVDEAALTFQRLLERTDLDALREAQLPRQTKAFLVDRWLARDPASAAARAAARFLEVVRIYDRALTALPSPLPIGAWHAAESHLLARGPPARTLVFPVGAALPHPISVETLGPEDAPVRLFWSFPSTALTAKDIVWSERLPAPVAGSYAFQAKHGLAWWQAPRVRRWAGPFLALLLASLLIPVALLLTLRRRRRLDEARIRFLNELAHDLRTPLTSLRLNADLLTGGKAKPERKDHYAARMAVEASRLSSLLANLLDLSRLERGRRDFDRVAVDVCELLEEARLEFVTVFPERAEDLVFEGDAEVAVYADRSALARVLANLLENAGKFTTPGTPIRVHCAPIDDGIQLVVADEGPGIPAQERRRVFERYARGEKAMKDGVPGTGLGLALVQDLVENMGGTVVLRSGPGAVFEIRLGATDA